MPRSTQLAGSTSTENGAYHALLARHDAMRLRRRMLSPCLLYTSPSPRDR
ncbi:hypothetical protein HET65_30380, partial [Streptomyces sp. McG5]|nr:hypothetical protein [Streptomyces sp. McG5]